MNKMTIRKSGGVGCTSKVKLAAILCAFAMMVIAFAFAPVDVADADKSVSVSSWDELQDAISHASGKTTITLTGDIIDDSDDDPVTIDDWMDIVIDLAGFKIDRQRGDSKGDDGRLFKVGNAGALEIRNGTLTGGHEDYGGCIYVKECKSVKLYDVIITGCYAEDDGGAIYSEYGWVEIHGGQITDNACGGDGGAIYSETSGYINMDGTTISDNRAEDDGGAFYSVDSFFNFENCTFDGNKCDGDGGAVFTKGVEEEGYYGENGFFNVTFSNNLAAENGGAICMGEDGYSFVHGCTFDGNGSGDNAGAIYAEDGKMSISNTKSYASVFKNNRTNNSGGALMLYGGTYYLEGTVFEGNMAWDHGGAIYINNETFVRITDCEFKSNHTKHDGGAILVGGDDNEIQIQGLIVIKDNISDRDGPNVFIRSDRKLTCIKALDKDSRIGIDLEDQKRKFTEDFSKYNPNTDPATIFFSDNSNYYIAADPDSGEAKTYKEGSGGDMSDNSTTIWIIVGIVLAVIAIAALVYVLKIRKPQ